MKISETNLPGVLILEPRRFDDARGYFQEDFNKKRFSENGIDVHFVQDNRSFSKHIHTVRGLHFQTAPYAQAKLVCCPVGKLLDVAVDLRPQSLAFRQHLSVELSQENGRMLLIPTGFGHGFCTLSADTQIEYKVSEYYAPTHDLGVNWLDEELGIKWPVDSNKAVLSEKDRLLPPLSEVSLKF